MPDSSLTEFFILPTRVGDAPLNMADDIALLELFPKKNTLRFRHYEWLHPCWTFGYSLPLKQILEIISIEKNARYCRRPTGGGLVRHQLDWTYSFVIPINSPFFNHPPQDLYKITHEALAKSLQIHGCSTELMPCTDNLKQKSLKPWTQRLSKRCFDKPEIFDLVLSNTHHKVAGLAMRRNHFGLLIQGSINKVATGNLNWDQFQGTFIHNLASLFNSVPIPSAWPSYPVSKIQEIRKSLESPDWNNKR